METNYDREMTCIPMVLKQVPLHECHWIYLGPVLAFHNPELSMGLVQKARGGTMLPPSPFDL